MKMKSVTTWHFSFPEMDSMLQGAHSTVGLLI